MAHNFFRRPLAILALVLGFGLIGAVVYRPWEASGAASSPIIGVVHQTEIRIAPEINARVDSFHVAAGQTVRKGDVLVTLSSPNLAAAVEQAKASLASANANRANVYAGVRHEEIDTAAQDVRIADANLALAQQQHERAAKLAAKDFASKQQLDQSHGGARQRRGRAQPGPSGLRPEQGRSDQGGAGDRRCAGRLR